MLRPSDRDLDMRKAGKPPSKPKKGGDQPTFL